KTSHMAKAGSLSGLFGRLIDHNEAKTFDNQRHAKQTGDMVNRGQRTQVRSTPTTDCRQRLAERSGSHYAGFQRSTHAGRSEEHTSELQSRENLVCRLLLEKKNTKET